MSAWLIPAWGSAADTLSIFTASAGLVGSSNVVVPVSIGVVESALRSSIRWMMSARSAATAVLSAPSTSRSSSAVANALARVPRRARSLVERAGQVDEATVDDVEAIDGVLDHRLVESSTSTRFVVALEGADFVEHLVLARIPPA